MIHQNLVETIIVPQFRLDINGIHGRPHWERVWENGQRVAAEIHKTRSGARNLIDLEVVELFAWLHDSQRQDDGEDWKHGVRAGSFARYLRNIGIITGVDDKRFSVLITALLFHSDELIEDEEVTIQTCWDADRMDLTRVGIVPDSRLLSKEAASLLRPDPLLTSHISENTK